MSLNHIKVEELNHIKIEELRKEDYYNGFLQLLEELTTVRPDEISFEDFCKRLDNMKSQVFVIRDNENKVIGTATILIEEKFIHKLGCVAHIEDVVVNTLYRRHGLGKLLIDHCVQYAKERECYKVILNCDEKNISFYERCGFKCKNVEMSYYV